MPVLFKGANYAELPLPDSSRIHPQVSHILLQNEIPLESTLAYLTYAHKNAIKTIFSPSPMLSQESLQIFPWEQLSWLIVNEGELEDLLLALEPNHTQSKTTAMSTTTTDSEAVRTKASELLNRLRTFMPSTNIICTLGAVGVLASYGSEIIYAPAARLPGPPVDTTGAGDCFTGYFVAGLMQFSRNYVPNTRDIEKVLERCTQV
jgi:ribokinase